MDGPPVLAHDSCDEALRVMLEVFGDGYSDLYAGDELVLSGAAETGGSGPEASEETQSATSASTAPSSSLRTRP